MSNMGYCRMQNTADDLQDCVDDWELGEDASDEEKKAQGRIIELAQEIVDKLPTINNPK